jgi:hypothetical protein
VTHILLQRGCLYTYTKHDFKNRHVSKIKSKRKENFQRDYEEQNTGFKIPSVKEGGGIKENQ